MYYNKKEYEALIKNSTLFTLDKGIQYSAYMKESLKMIEYLYCYLLAICEEKYIEYGYEITRTAKNCINNFDASKGEFLHYFNAAWKHEYKRLCMLKTEEEKYRGLKISKDDMRNIRKYKRLSKSRGIDCTSDKFISNLADAMNLSFSDVMEVIKLSEINVISSSVQDNNDEEINLFDILSSDISIERNIIEEESLLRLLKNIEEVFEQLQERQKPIISAIITAQICPIICTRNLDNDNFKFVDKQILKEHQTTGKILSQKDIAQMFKRKESSISRTKDKFIRKLNMRKVMNL